MLIKMLTLKRKSPAKFENRGFMRITGVFCAPKNKKSEQI